MLTHPFTKQDNSHQDLPWLLKTAPTSSNSKKQGEVREKNKEKKNRREAQLKGRADTWRSGRRSCGRRGRTPRGLCAPPARAPSPRALRARAWLTSQPLQTLASPPRSSLSSFWPCVLPQNIAGTRSPSLLPAWEAFVGDCAASQVALVAKNPPATARDQETGFDPGLVGILWRRAWRPTPVFLPGESHGQRRLTDSSPWGHSTESRTQLRDLAHIEIVQIQPCLDQRPEDTFGLGI